MKKLLTLVANMTLCAALLLSAAGCQTYGEAAGAGAAIGALAGGIIGNQSGNALEGAAIGAAVGAAGGAIAHDIKVRRAKSREETVVDYNYQPERGMELHFRDASVLPSSTTPGRMVEASIEYALLGSQQGVSVRESRRLLRGGQVVADLSDKAFTRTDGTWVSTLPFEVPRNLQPGVYTMQQQVWAGELHISRAVDFNVLAY